MVGGCCPVSLYVPWEGASWLEGWVIVEFPGKEGFFSARYCEGFLE